MFRKTALSLAALGALSLAALAPTSASATGYGYGGGHSAGYVSGYTSYNDTGYYFKRVRVPYYTLKCKYYNSYKYGYGHKVKRCFKVKHYKYITKKIYY